MTNTMSYNSCVNPWHYNFVTLFAGYVPWTLLVVLSLFSLTYHKFNIQPAAWWKRFTAWIKNMDPVDLFSFTSIVVIFVFYCIPQSKRSVYLMPIYPSLLISLPNIYLSGQEAIQSHQSIWKYSCGNQPVAVHLLHCIKMRAHP